MVLWQKIHILMKFTGSLRNPQATFLVRDYLVIYPCLTCSSFSVVLHCEVLFVMIPVRKALRLCEVSFAVLLLELTL